MSTIYFNCISIAVLIRMNNRSRQHKHITALLLVIISLHSIESNMRLFSYWLYY